MHLEIITPNKKVYDGFVESATFPGIKGSFQVLKNHAPIISSLETGQIKYVNEKGKFNVMISGGIVEVIDNQITVLAESIIE